MGLGYTFNGQPARDVLKPSMFLEQAEKALRWEVYGSRNWTIQKGNGGQQNLGLTFYLDRHTVFRSSWRKADESLKASFNIAINNAFNG
ncbi:MAG: hypothetical protein AAF492_15375, partial [Verrucomicrobiota bacterium]